MNIDEFLKSKDLKNPRILADCFFGLMKYYKEEGGLPDYLAILKSSVVLAKPFAGKKELSDQELDIYSRIVTATVDGFYSLRN